MIIAFDCETTGIPKDYKAPLTDSDNWPRIVQLAWAVHDPRTKCRLFEGNLIVKPVGFIIPHEASEVHGITHQRAEADGVDLEMAVNMFLASLDICDTIVGHNVGFDKNIIGAEMIRLNSRKPAEMDRKTICTMMSATKFCALPAKNGRGHKWPKLEELHRKLFDCDFDGAHDAMEDVSATVRCFFALKDKGIL